MSHKLRMLAAMLLCTVAPRVSFAQTCAVEDAAVGLCVLSPTNAQATVTPATAGYVGAGPVVAAARYLGGIAFFESSVYFLPGYLSSGFDPFQPLARSSDYLLIGGKPENSSIVDTPGPWIQLPSTYAANQEMTFLLKVRTCQLSATVTSCLGTCPTCRDAYYYSGVTQNTINNTGRASQDVGGVPSAFSWAFSRVFGGGTAPAGDTVFATGRRKVSPPSWTGSYANGNGYFGASGAKSVVGWEDDAGQSDGDFNDAVIALDFAQAPTTVTPEPSTIALTAAGLLAMVGVARRRGRKNVN